MSSDRITKVALVTKRPSVQEVRATIQHCFDAFVEGVTEFNKLTFAQQLNEHTASSAVFTLTDTETGLKFHVCMALHYVDDESEEPDDEQ